MLGESHYQLASIYLEQKDYTKSINHYTNSIKLNFNKEYSLYNRGVSYLNLEDLDSAKKDFEKVVEIAKDKTIKQSAQEALDQYPVIITN